MARPWTQPPAPTRSVFQMVEPGVTLASPPSAPGFEPSGPESLPAESLAAPCPSDELASGFPELLCELVLPHPPSEPARAGPQRATTPNKSLARIPAAIGRSLSGGYPLQPICSARSLRVETMRRGGAAPKLAGLRSRRP